MCSVILSSLCNHLMYSITQVQREKRHKPLFSHTNTVTFHAALHPQGGFTPGPGQSFLVCLLPAAVQKSFSPCVTTESLKHNFRHNLQSAHLQPVCHYTTQVLIQDQSCRVVHRVKLLFYLSLGLSIHLKIFCCSIFFLFKSQWFPWKPFLEDMDSRHSAEGLCAYVVNLSSD